MKKKTELKQIELANFGVKDCRMGGVQVRLGAQEEVRKEAT